MVLEPGRAGAPEPGDAAAPGQADRGKRRRGGARGQRPGHSSSDLGGGPGPMQGGGPAAPPTALLAGVGARREVSQGPTLARVGTAVTQGGSFPTRRLHAKKPFAGYLSPQQASGSLRKLRALIPSWGLHLHDLIQPGFSTWIWGAHSVLNSGCDKKKLAVGRGGGQSAGEGDERNHGLGPGCVDFEMGRGLNRTVDQMSILITSYWMTTKICIL